MRIRKLFYYTALLSVMVLTQNCSDADFGGGFDVRDPNSLEGALDVGIPEEDGVDGGDIDVTTATSVYGDSVGTTNHHVPAYDDKHSTNVVDFFDMIDNDFDEVDEVVSPRQVFYIVVANGDLNPLVGIEINGVQFSPNVRVHGPFSLSNVSHTPTSEQLITFRAIVAKEAILLNGLATTQTDCVVFNQFSVDNRYRNGALTIQIIRSSEINSLSPVLGVATIQTGFLWESTIYHHETSSGCR